MVRETSAGRHKSQVLLLLAIALLKLALPPVILDLSLDCIIEVSPVIKLHRLCRIAGIFGLALALGTVDVAQAHAKLQSTVPPADASVSSPNLIQVHFNEAVEPKMSGIKLAASDGTSVPVMSMNDAKDPATLSVKPSAPLKAGLYRVTWRAVTDDGHKTQGTFSFTVR